MDSLISQGISSSVVFNVADGDYNEQFFLPQISGTSATNTITFQGNETDSTRVRLYFNNQTVDGNAFVIYYLDGATDYIFRKMTFEAQGTEYARIVYMWTWENAHRNVIENCLFKGQNTTNNSTYLSLIYCRSTQPSCSNIAFRNNVFLNGSYGIFIHAFGGISITDLEITGNQFFNQNEYGVYLIGSNGATVINNSLYLANGPAYGIRLNNCDGDISVQGNTMEIESGSYPGLQLDYCDGTILDRGLTVNNMITIDGTTENFGILLNACTYQGVYQNSVNVINTDEWSSGFYGSGGNHNEVISNNFSNYGGGLAYRVLDANVVSSSDYNNYYSSGLWMVQWISSRHYSISLLRESNGDDAHSISVHPRFHTPTDLHTNTYWLDGKGVAVTGITTDIDGESRSDPPDIGADEFEPIMPLSGVYKIGGDTPDYVTIREAFDDLEVKGVIGPTTFEIRSGEYNEFLGTVNYTLGANKNDTIVFTSESGNPKDVKLYYSTDNTNDYIIDLVTHHLSIMNISITATGENNGGAIKIRGGTSNINILNNILSLANTTDPVVSVTVYSRDDIVIKNNSFIKGSKGIFFYGDQSDPVTNTSIIENTFTGMQSHAIELKYHFAPRIIGNIISNDEYSNFIPIEMTNCNENLEVSGNIINNSPGEYGIILDDCVATNPFEGFIANNMIEVGGTGAASGIEISNSSRMNLYYNSINVTCTDPLNGKALLIGDNNAEINLFNNIIANTGSGYGLYVNDPTDITLSDYNGIYSSGTKLASWGGSDYVSLSSLKVASGLDVHSIEAEPAFYPDEDRNLMTMQILFHKAAVPLADVQYDIDSIPRDPSTPDIGAMEFSCVTPDFDIAVSATCFGDTTTFIDNTSHIAPLSLIYWDIDDDFNPDYTSEGLNDTIMHLFTESGIQTVNYIVYQIAGCNDYNPINVAVKAPPSLELVIDGAYCGNDDGQVTVNVLAGSPPYNYSWSNDSTGSSVTGLALGTYTVGVSDVNNCITSETVVIEDRMKVTVTELSGSTCGASDGSAIALATGGVEPYNYVWSNGETTANNDILSPGLHYVNAIDDNGCYARGSINIDSDGSGPQITLESTVHNECFGDRDGALEISISGGIMPYSIQWSNGLKTESINNLLAGIYDVIVMDHDSCVSYASFPVTQPPKLNIGTVVQQTSCAGADGKAVAVASGGTEPYLYLWSTGGVYQIEENLAAGIYSVTVTDINGCQTIEPVIVNDAGGPVVSLKEMTGVTCTDPAGGSIDINISGGTPLYTYTWSPGGEISQDISDLPVGTYEVEVIDNAGCVGVNQFEIAEDPPPVQPICMVTVDTLTGKNLIIWEKSGLPEIDYYNIYRETSRSGEYQLIGSRDVDSLSIFLDSIADPNIRSWRYRISAVDTCGNESRLSEPHKTIHLTMNLGVGGTVNLIWDHYEGFEVGTYEVYRYSSAAGWENLASLPSNLTSYTDDNPPEDEELYYMIEVDHPSGGCTATEGKSSTYDTSRSNRTKTTDVKSAISGIESLYHLLIYPNPAKEWLTVEVGKDNLRVVVIEIVDIKGQIIYQKQCHVSGDYLEKNIPLNSISPGLYILRLRIDNEALYRKISIL